MHGTSNLVSWWAHFYNRLYDETRNIFLAERSKKKSVWDYKLCSTCSSQSSGGRWKNTLRRKSFDFLCFRVPDDGRRRWLFLFRVKIPLIMRALNMRKMSNMKLADESEMCNGEHDEKNWDDVDGGQWTTYGGRNELHRCGKDRLNLLFNLHKAQRATASEFVSCFANET